MKKFILSVLTSVSALFFLGACKSAPVYITDNSPVAIITIIGNPDMPWLSEDESEDSTSGLITGTMNTLLGTENPEISGAVDRLDYADESVRKILPEVAGCKIINKSDVISSKRYKKLGESYFNFLDSIKRGTNYKDFTTIGGKNARMLAKELNANSLLIMDLNCFKKRVNTHACCAVIDLKMKVISSKGKEIINKTYRTESKNVEKDGSYYDQDELIAAIPAAIDAAVMQFALEYNNPDAIPGEEASASDGTTAEQTEDLSRYAVPLKIKAKTNAEPAPEQTPPEQN